MRNIDGEDWTDMLILDNKPKLDHGMIESGDIFNHNKVTSMGFTITNVYNANLAGNSPQKQSYPVPLGK